jgi:hypothetical protein
MTGMSVDDPKDPKAFPRPNQDASYDVGYGKPPVATRFKPGRSGNAKGRPKGSRRSKPGDVTVERLKALVMEEVYRPIQIRDGGVMVEMPVIQAAVRSLALNAAKGKQRAQRMLFDLTTGVETERRRERENLFEAVVDYKNYWASEIASARRRGVSEPAPLPHPDHLIVDPLTGSVVSRGPWTEADKAYLENATALKSEMVVELKNLEKRLLRTPDDETLQQRKKALRSVLARIDRVLSAAERVLVACGRRS